MLPVAQRRINYQVLLRDQSLTWQFVLFNLMTQGPQVQIPIHKVMDVYVLKLTGKQDRGQ